MTRPRVARRTRRCSSVPEMPATESEVRKASLIVGSLAPARRMPTSASGVRRSRRERPEPSAITTPRVGTPATRSSCATTSCPGRRRSVARDRGSELLQQDLRDEVVALTIHLAHDVDERVGEVDGERERVVRVPSRSSAHRAPRLRAARARRRTTAPRRLPSRSRRRSGRHRPKAPRAGATRSRHRRASSRARRVGRRSSSRPQRRGRSRARMPQAATSRASARRSDSRERRVAVAHEVEVAVPDPAAPARRRRRPRS